MSGVHICSFQAGQDVTRKTKYEDLKAEILKVGRFSCFEASANALAAGMFTRLCKDPEVEILPGALEYPWTAVRLRAPAETGQQERKKQA